MPVDLSQLQGPGGYRQPQQALPVGALSALSIDAEVVTVTGAGGEQSMLAFTFHTTFGRLTFMVPAPTVVEYLAPRVAAAAARMTAPPGLTVPQLVPQPTGGPPAAPPAAGRSRSRGR